jgi:glycosyltransferase involved in cell wall biosynthesis
MRLLFVTPSYAPMLGGGEHYVQALAEELARRGHALTVVTSAIARQQDFWAGCTVASGQAITVGNGVTVMRLPVRAAPFGRTGQLAERKAMVLAATLLGPVTEPLLTRCSRAFPGILGLDEALAQGPRPDLVHTFNISWERCLLAGHALAQSRGIPHVVTPFLHVGAPGQRRVWRNSAMPQQRRVLFSARAVLALSAAEREGLLSLGVGAKAAHVVGAAVAPPSEQHLAADPTLVARLARFGHPLILFLGRVDRDKGALTAMRAVAALNSQGVPCQLALAGQPSSEASRLARRLCQTGAPLHLLGAVSEGAKQWLLQHCSALVLPSRVESFGLVLLEAWQHGKPVVAADMGGPQSLVRPGEDGLLTPWGDVSALAAALKTLLTDPAYARQMGEAGRLKAARAFTWPQVADRVEAVYRAVLARPSGELA